MKLETQDYDSLLSSMEFSEADRHILEQVKVGQAADQKSSPFTDDKWYKKFTKDNPDGFNFAEAPCNVFLMVVSESFGTLIQHNRGTAVSRGSVIVKLDDKLINCIDGTYWYASPSGTACIYSQHGYFGIGESTYGKLKLLSDIK